MKFLNLFKKKHKYVLAYHMNKNQEIDFKKMNDKDLSKFYLKEELSKIANKLSITISSFYTSHNCNLARIHFYTYEDSKKDLFLKYFNGEFTDKIIIDSFSMTTESK